MQNKLRTLAAALAGISTHCYHYTAANTTAPAYIIWAEESENILYGDDDNAERCWRGTIDAYSRTEFDSLFDDVDELLSDICAAYELLSVQYEESTGLIHYEWSFEYA